METDVIDPRYSEAEQAGLKFADWFSARLDSIDKSNPDEVVVAPKSRKQIRAEKRRKAKEEKARRQAELSEERSLPGQLSKAFERPYLSSRVDMKGIIGILGRVVTILQDSNREAFRRERLRKSIIRTFCTNCSRYPDNYFRDDFLSQYVLKGGKLPVLFSILSEDKRISSRKLKMVLTAMTSEELMGVSQQTRKCLDDRSGKSTERYKRMSKRLPVIVLVQENPLYRLREAIREGDPKKVLSALRDANARIAKAPKKKVEGLTNLVIQTLDEGFAGFSREDFIDFVKEYSKISEQSDMETFYEFMQQGKNQLRSDIVYIVTESGRDVSEREPLRLERALSVDSGRQQQEEQRDSEVLEGLEGFVRVFRKKQLKQLRSEILSDCHVDLHRPRPVERSASCYL
ncbi:hypothetical protein ACFL0U_03555 [Pseudomonadota bacterium]